MEVGSCDLLGEFSGLSDVIEQFSASSILQHNREAFIDNTALGFADCVLTDADQLDQVLVVHFLHNF
jgi:hypothetical protein